MLRPRSPTLVLGTPVEVEGTLNADGSVTASEISIEDRNEVERIAFVGTLTKIAGNTLTVDGVTVNVGSATVIVKGDTTLTLADLKLGDHLLVSRHRSGRQEHQRHPPSACCSARASPRRCTWPGRSPPWAPTTSRSATP